MSKKSRWDDDDDDFHKKKSSKKDHHQRQRPSELSDEMIAARLEAVIKEQDTKDNEKYNKNHNKNHNNNNRNKQSSGKYGERQSKKRKFTDTEEHASGSGGGGISDLVRGEDEGKFEWGKQEEDEDALVDADGNPIKKQKPNFEVSGALNSGTSTGSTASSSKGTIEGKADEVSAGPDIPLKYFEPEESRMPKVNYRLYVFKGDEVLEKLHLHRKPFFLVGRDRRIVDIPTDHLSCSSQHAVIQYRLVDVEGEDGMPIKKIKPYLIDLKSSNGTKLNGKVIKSKRFYELRAQDMINFGHSSRDYVLIRE